MKKMGTRTKNPGTRGYHFNKSSWSVSDVKITPRKGEKGGSSHRLTVGGQKGKSGRLTTKVGLETKRTDATTVKQVIRTSGGRAAP